MELYQCSNCGHGGWTVYELKDGLCPFCIDYGLEDDYNGDEDELLY